MALARQKPQDFMVITKIMQNKPSLQRVQQTKPLKAHT